MRSVGALFSHGKRIYNNVSLSSSSCKGVLSDLMLLVRRWPTRLHRSKGVGPGPSKTLVPWAALLKPC